MEMHCAMFECGICEVWDHSNQLWAEMCVHLYFCVILLRDTHISACYARAVGSANTCEVALAVSTPVV